MPSRLPGRHVRHVKLVPQFRGGTWRHVGVARCSGPAPLQADGASAPQVKRSRLSKRNTRPPARSGPGNCRPAERVAHRRQPPTVDDGAPLSAACVPGDRAPGRALALAPRGGPDAPQSLETWSFNDQCAKELLPPGQPSDRTTDDRGVPWVRSGACSNSIVRTSFACPCGAFPATSPVCRRA